MSSPGQHAHNGLAEIAIQRTQNKVTAMYCQAPYSPKQLWPHAWDLAEIIESFRQSRIPGDDRTRFEAFTHKVPNYRELVILPWCSPVSYFIPAEQRDKVNYPAPHASMGMYIGPDLLTTGGILIWNPKSKRILTVNTYTVRPYNEAPYAWKPLDPVSGVSLFDANENNDTSGTISDLIVPAHVDVADTQSANLSPAVPEAQLSEGVSSDLEVSTSSNNHTNTSEESITTIIPTISHDTIPSESVIVSTTPTIDIPASNNSDINIATESNSSSITPTPSPSEGESHTRLRKPPEHLQDYVMVTKKKSKSTSGAARRARRNADINRTCSFEGIDVDYNIKAKHQEYTCVKAKNKRVYLLVRKYDEFKRTLRRVLKSLRKVKTHDIDKPTMKQAQNREDWPQWEEAINREYEQMYDEGVFSERNYSIKELPRKANLLGTMFTLVVKRDKATGEVDKYKARLVALGNQQKSSSYDMIKSNTARSASVKMLMAIQAKTGAKSMILDVKGAYLKSSIKEWKEENLFIRLPDGRIKKLEKYIYGLKQAGAEWESNITSTLLDAGYKQSVDPLVLSKRIGKDFIIMSLHVDDFYCISSKNYLLDQLYDMLVDKYDDVTRKSGDLLTYLGMAVKKLDDGSVKVYQPAYIEKILSVAKLDNVSKMTHTPMAVNQDANDRYSNVSVDKKNYLQLVGLINYLAIYTRPDLLYSLSFVAQACSNPTQADLKRVKRIIRHIASTKHFGLIFNTDDDFQLTGHVDASHNQYKDGKGHYGYTFSIGKYNASFTAKSSKMKLVTLSSTESEYVALCLAVKEAVYLRGFLNSIGFKQHGPTIIYEDNQSTIKMVYSDLNHQTTKHIAPKYHYTREQVQRSVVKIEYIATEEQQADLLTKALFTDVHQVLTAAILNFKF